MDNNFLIKHLPENFKKIVSNIMDGMVSSGSNALYTFKSKAIIMPEKDMVLAAFHEMGHAANSNLSKFGKLLQKCRPLMLLAGPIALIALFKSKKAPDEKPEGAVDKTTTFIKNNAGKLTFLSFIPMLLEEGMASIKGLKFAEKALSPELIKKVAKTNKLGFITYMGLALASSLGVYLGVKVKDAIAKPKPVEEKTV